MSEFKRSEKLIFSEVIAEITTLLAEGPQHQIVEVYNKLTDNYTKLKSLNGVVFEKVTYDKVKKGEYSQEIVIGAFYELPDGRITRTYRSNSIERKIYHVFDKESGDACSSYEEVQSWKKRDDLKDYPEARDPRLPYEFDLYWDIKHESELFKLFEEHSMEWLLDKGIMKTLIAFPKLNKKLRNKYNKI